MSVTLPPLPERPWRMFCTKCGRSASLPVSKVQHPVGKPDVSFAMCPCGYLAFAEQDKGHAEEVLRARDLEVARVLLEAAAKACGHLAQADAVAAAIRALEVRHHE